MVIALLTSLLFGASAFILMLILPSALDRLTKEHSEKELRRLLPDIQPGADRTSLERLTRVGPWVAFCALLYFVFFARSALSTAVIALLVYYGLRGPRILHRVLKRKQDERLNAQLPDVLNAVANSVKAGESVPIAFESVCSKFDAPVTTVLQHIVNRFNAGEKFEDALLKVASKLQLDSFDYLARSLALHLRRGGPAYEMLIEVRTGLVEQDRVDRMVRATTAAGRFTMKFLTYSPLFLVPMLLVLQPDFLNTLFGSFLGVTITLLAVGLYFFALRWTKAILDLERL